MKKIICLIVLLACIIFVFPKEKKIEDYLNNLGFNVDVYDENHLDFHEIFETGVSLDKKQIYKGDIVAIFNKKIVLIGKRSIRYYQKDMIRSVKKIEN